MESEPTIVPPGDECQRARLTPISPNSPETVHPFRKKLLPLESQRIVGVLDKCIHEMELVVRLPSSLAQAEIRSMGFGAEGDHFLMEHLHQVEAYHTLSLQEDLHQDIRTKQQVAAQRAVQVSLKDLLRILRTHPSAEVGLKMPGPITEEQKPIEDLVKGLQELRIVLLERLLTTPREEREHRQHSRELGKRHHANLELIATLETEVALAIKDRDEEISKMDEVIQKLKSSLDLMEKTSDDFVVRTQRDGVRQHQSDEKTSEGKQTHLQEEANRLRLQLSHLLTEHREKEMVLRKKNQKVETEIENWIQKYDADMGKKQMELEELTQVFEEEVVELRQVEEHYTVMELEFTQIMEERRLMRERMEEEERERETKKHAATIIQAFWRGWLVRKFMRSKDKKSKKGKKSKKK